MKYLINKNQVFLFLILSPLLLYFLTNVYIIDREYNERIQSYWNLHYISIVSIFIFSFNRKFIQFLSQNKQIILSIFFVYFIGILASSYDINFSSKIFIQFLVIPLIMCMSFYLGFSIKSNKELSILLVYLSKIFFLVSFIVLVIEFSEHNFDLFLLRPYVWSFYFNVFALYIILTNKHDSYFNKLFFLLIAFIMVLFSGSRSSLILTLLFAFHHFITFKKKFLIHIIFFGILFLIIQNSFFDLLYESRYAQFEYSQKNISESPRQLIWEIVLNKISLNNNYIIGNGFVRPDFSTAYERISIAHNTYLQFFYTFGILGSLFFLPLIISFFKSIYYYSSLILIGFLIISFINDLPIILYEFARIGECIIFYVFFALLYFKK